MRLFAEVEIRNLLTASIDPRPSKKWSKACLSIGKKNPKDDFSSLQICTKSNRNGTYYKLLQNVEKVFSKFANDGKCTIRTKTPHEDILISKADPVSLGYFLNVVRVSCQSAHMPESKSRILLPASSVEMTSLKTKLVIQSKKDYPVRTNFPQRLEHLTVVTCGLCCIDSRILNLDLLKTLDLSNNNIKKLPENWDGLKSMLSLDLSKNQIEEISRGFLTGRLKSQLRSLDVSSNLISYLPNSISEFTALFELNLSSNRLKRIPHNILKMPSLMALNVSDNLLEFFPGRTDASRTLDLLDILGNEALMYDRVDVKLEGLSDPPTLLELSARSIINNRVRHTEADVGRFLKFYLDAVAQQCQTCGRACFESRAVLRAPAPSTFAHSSFSGRTVFCEQVFCSRKCWGRREVQILRTT